MNLITQAGGKAFVLQADISDENQVIAMFTAIDQHDEPLAALVNNAGILFTQCTVENLTAERINRVLSTNVTGYFLCCRSINPLLIRLMASMEPLFHFSSKKRMN